MVAPGPIQSLKAEDLMSESESTVACGELRVCLSLCLRRGKVAVIGAFCFPVWSARCLPCLLKHVRAIELGSYVEVSSIYFRLYTLTINH